MTGTHKWHSRKLTAKDIDEMSSPMPEMYEERGLGGRAAVSASKNDVGQRLLKSYDERYPVLSGTRSYFWTAETAESYIPGDKEKFYRQYYRRGHIFLPALPP